MFYKNALQKQAKWLLPLLMPIAFCHPVAAQQKQDTLTLNLQQAEKVFIDSNFLLLAQHYNVDAQKALVEQAKVWQNPTLNTDFMVGADGKYFQYHKNPDGSYNGQYYIQVQQLILTAKKRGKLIDLANTNARLSELQLQDVLRNLRYQLHQDYYNIQQQLALLGIYNGQAVQLSKLVAGMKAQLDAGNIARKDYVRVQALSIGLQQDMVELQKSLADNQADLKTLLQIKDANQFVKPAESLSGDVAMPDNLESLINTALQTNPSYLLQQSQTKYQQQNLVYQKALKTPDITLGPNFDRNSNFAPNYVGLGVSLPLPVFNKNKGNIKSAEANIKQQQAITQNAETELRNNINNAYKKLALSIELNNSTQKDFYSSYTAIYNNMIDSYKQRQINLLEFLDFFNDYTDSQKKLLGQQLNLQLAKEELQYHVNR
ncbi:TolC family protein [Parasediminibacterium sp. JCM 36343]|uniref:TolC family protein n=1 Tax=Parasediminibacterium sp. JCM 36343 TaxID=3374279 RepID=UPI00397D1CA0